MRYSIMALNYNSKSRDSVDCQAAVITEGQQKWRDAVVRQAAGGNWMAAEVKSAMTIKKKKLKKGWEK